MKYKMTDHYKTLGVNPTATESEITAAYKKKALLFHPDKNKGKEIEAAAIFQDITEAYNILNDFQERANYDRSQSKSEGHTRHHQAPPKAAPSKEIEQEFLEYIRDAKNFHTVSFPDHQRTPETFNKLKDFVEHGLNVNIEFKAFNHEYSLLKLGLNLNNVDFIKFLVLKGAKTNQIIKDHNNNSYLPFTFALEKLPDSDIASHLINNETLITYSTLKHTVLQKKFIFLLTMIQETERRGEHFPTIATRVGADGVGNLLHDSVDTDNAHSIKLLLDSGVDINALSLVGNTPLHMAVRDNRYHAMRVLLLDKNADLKITNSQGKTIFTMAIEKNDRWAVNEIIAAAQRQNIFADLVENYLEGDKVKKTQHEAIALRLKLDPKILQELEYKKLIALNDLMTDPNILLPLIEALVEKGHIGAQATIVAEGAANDPTLDDGTAGAIKANRKRSLSNPEEEEEVDITSTSKATSNNPWQDLVNDQKSAAASKKR